MANRSSLEFGESSQVKAGDFYENYHGHRIRHLQAISERFSGLPSRPRCIYLAGDSSLDNKHWFFRPHIPKKEQMFDSNFTADAVNGYEQVLQPPRMVMDVSYWMNRLAHDRLGPSNAVTINTSVEESTIEDRSGGLMPQDEFLRDQLRSDDFLILSLGGNDVALKPTARTILSMFLLTRSPQWLISAGWAPGMSYFEGLFGTRIEELVRQLTAGNERPKKVLLCMIYFLDEQPGGSWADNVLEKLGYDSDPSKLQLIIRTLFERLSERGFHVPGTEVEPFPLYEVLDGKTPGDYVQRVEPSVQGGRKMAEAFLTRLFPDEFGPAATAKPNSAT